MSETAGLIPGLSGARKLGGTTRLILGFVLGALFGLVPMYYFYFYMGREAGLRAAASQDAPVAAALPPDHASIEPAGPRARSKPFASRLTYELSRAPEERPAPPPPPRVMPAGVASAASMPLRIEDKPRLPAAASVIAAAPSAERIENARPISVVPLDPRDRTVEIERETSEYREIPRPQAKVSPLESKIESLEPKAVLPEPKAGSRDAKAATAHSKAAAEQPRAAVFAKGAPDAPKVAASTRPSPAPPKASPAPPPRVFEGRPVELKPVEKAAEGAARSAPSSDAAAPRAEPETERVGGVTPIKPLAKGLERTVVATAPATTVELPAPRAETPARAASESEVESRLDATRGWLAASPPTTHTIQLMGTNSEEQLKAQLKALSKVVEPDKLYIFRTKAQGKPSITVVYGAYADRQSALQALEKLPASIAANKPVLRTVSGIRAEVKQANADGG